MKWLLLFLCCALCSCRRGMVDQSRVKPLAEVNLFADGRGARPIPQHTVARGFLEDEETFFTGMTNGELLAQFPLPVTHDLLTRGRERFEIYCSVCHGPAGSGDGMIVQRGFPKPPSFHELRLREAPIGHFYDVIRNGYGAMFSYASRLEPQDRWAIVAYIRALQLSQHAVPTDVPRNEFSMMEAVRK